jgi:2-dehydropantoate 2-reductase
MVNNAAGPDALIRSLGRERVICGFPGAGGAKDRGVIQTYFDEAAPMPIIGELDGQITPRLQDIAAVFKKAGMNVTLSRDIDAWLKTHVALVSPMADAVYMAGGNIYALAHERHTLALMLRAIKEGFDVLRALDIPVTPFKLRLLGWLPVGLLVPWVARKFNTKSAETGIQRHANAARDEMKQLADEFKALAIEANIPTPAIDQLRQYITVIPAQKWQPAGV